VANTYPMPKILLSVYHLHFAKRK